MSPHGLPQPDAESRARSARLVGRIRSEMESSSGRLSFARYMDQVLNAHGLGYYRSSDRQFGREGDFVTAPELSPLFARCVARQVGQILAHLDGGEVFEAGAGSGALCADLLLALEDSGRVPERYLILEPSAALRRRQREHIEGSAPRHAPRVVWVDDLPAAGFVGVILCNELLDAVPAPRFKKSRNGLLEAFVCQRGGGFGWCYGEPEYDGLIEAVAEIEAALGVPFADGYTSELGLAREAWISSAAERLRRGAVLLLDYGHTLSEYYHPQRREGTLTCHYRHRVHDDPFFFPGLQDISVQVEFSGLCCAARAAGLEVAGFTTQAEFLIASGLLDACREHDPGSLEYVRLISQIKRLTLPGEMGQLFKALALTREVNCPLTGFAGRDYRDRL
jgi:SAM-dependent MidA family methyltransferase